MKPVVRVLLLLVVLCQAFVEGQGRMEMLIRGEKTSFGWRQRAFYDLTGDGPVARIEETSTEDDRKTTTTAVRKADQLLIQSQGPGQRKERSTPLPKEN